MAKKCCEAAQPSKPLGEDGLLFVMVGNPNVGKTTLINAMSGASLRIGNWPGTTVERMETNFLYHYCPKDGEGPSVTFAVASDEEKSEASAAVTENGTDAQALPHEKNGAYSQLSVNNGKAPGVNAGTEKTASSHSSDRKITAALSAGNSEKNKCSCCGDGRCTCGQGRDIDVHLVDLPGAYGLTTSTAEEKVTRDELLTRLPDAVINVVDAGNLERNLALTIELIELGVPVIIALNLLDEAKDKGLRPNIEALAQALDVPIVPTVAVREEGVKELVHKAVHTKCSSFKVRYSDEIEAAVEDLCSFLNSPSARWIAIASLVGDDLDSLADISKLVPDAKGERQHKALELPSDFRKKAAYYRKKFAESGTDCFLEIADARYRMARKLSETGQAVSPGVHRLTQKIDKWVLHPVMGIPIFLLFMLLLFRFTYLFSQPWIDWLSCVKDVFMGWTASIGHLHPLLRSFIMNGILEGAGTVLAMTPVLFVLYIGMSFMEASGFLARSSFLVDRIMKGMNLPGKAFIPMLIGFGCNVAGIAATKTLESGTERLRVSLAVPFAPCSARMAVFTFLAAVFFPGHASYALFTMYALGIAMGLATIMLMGKVLKSDDSGSIMELPPYRIPTLKVIWKQAWSRTCSFLESVGGAILIAVAFIWIINSFPAGGDLNSSYFARISHYLTGFTSTFGVDDWRLAGALVPGFVAKEVVVGTLAVSWFGSGSDVAAMTLGTGLESIVVSFFDAVWNTIKAVPQMAGLLVPSDGSGDGPVGLAAKLLGSTSPAGALAYMVFVLLYVPCIGTIGALKSEFGWKWAAISIAYSVFVAWAAAVIVWQLNLGSFLS